MFVSAETVIEIASDMQSRFEFDLHSQSSISEIARAAREELADRGLPTRKSLSVVIAKVALMTWQSTIFETKHNPEGNHS
jgi:hypothetical protein